MEPTTPNVAAPAGVGDAHPVRNPRTGQYDYAFHPPTAEQLGETCASVRAHQVAWAASGVERRIDALQRWKTALAHHRTTLVDALVTDTGRRIESVLEVDIVERSIDRWCGIARNFFAQNRVKTSSIPFVGIRQDEVPFPLVGVISPWNFPLLLAMIDTLPALLAGCGVVVKPSEITPRFIDPLTQSIADVPELAGVLAFVAGAGDTGARLVQQVDLVCFTGSVATGRGVYRAAAERFIPAFLELGGKDPALVFEGADLDLATSSVLWGSTVNCGHSCLSIERVYVQDTVFEPFVAQLVAKAERVRLAHPTVDDGQIGPVISDRQVAIIDEHLRDALAQGATILTGNTRCELRDGGYWCRPTVLTNVSHGMKLMTEETFGPLIPVMPFRDEDEAVALANGTRFGLSGAVFARDTDEAFRIGQRLEAGAISLNDCALTAVVHEGEKNSFRMSGLGGTRMGPGAIRRFMRQRAFLVKNAPVASPWWF